MIASSHFPAFFFFSLSPGVNSSALSTSTAGTIAASIVPLLLSLLFMFILAAMSLFFTSFLILGHSSDLLELVESFEEPLR